MYLSIMCNRNIPPAAKAVYAYLAARCGASEECYPSVETITRDMGMVKDTFYRHINTLIAAGIVEKHQSVSENGKFGRTIYRLTHEITISEKHDFPRTDNSETGCSTTDNLERKDNIQKDNIGYQEIADLYNRVCVSFPKLTKLSDKRKKAIRARFKQGYTTDDFEKVFELAEGSRFLKGGNKHNWRATFDWMIQDANIVKILDGNYTDVEGGEKDATTTDKSGRSTRNFYERLVGTGDGDYIRNAVSVFLIRCNALLYSNNNMGRRRLQCVCDNMVIVIMDLPRARKRSFWRSAGVRISQRNFCCWSPQRKATRQYAQTFITALSGVCHGNSWTSAQHSFMASRIFTHTGAGRWDCSGRR